MLSMGAATVLTVAASVNKATRFQVTWLPAIVLLATALPVYVLSNRLRIPALAALAAIGAIVSLHVSFGLLPVGPIRYQDWRLLDSRFPLNVPDAFDDNHPLDRRDFRLREVVPIIARDAADRLQRGRPSKPGQWNWGCSSTMTISPCSLRCGTKLYTTLLAGHGDLGPDAPDYICAYGGFHAVYPGAHFLAPPSTLESDAVSGRIPYGMLIIWT